MALCKNCQSEIREDWIWKVCPYCDTLIENITPAAQPQSVSAGSSSPVIGQTLKQIILVCILSVLIGALSVRIGYMFTVDPDQFFKWSISVSVSYFLLMSVTLFILRKLNYVSSLKLIFFTPVTWLLLLLFVWLIGVRLLFLLFAN